jgi:CRP/FNR family transcriptional regulator
VSDDEPGGKVYQLVPRSSEPGVREAGEVKHCAVCLRELPLFNGLEAADFTQVCLRATKLRAAKGQCLFHQGELANAVYLIKAGKVKLVQVTAGGRAAILDVLGPGEVLGETALFQDLPQAFSALVLEEAKLCSFSRHQFEDMIRANPGAATSIITHLARRLYDSMQQAGEISGAPVREKVLRVLLHLADKYGHPAKNATQIELAITQQELADMVGASRVMVANVLKELYDEGLVHRRDGRYSVNRKHCM